MPEKSLSVDEILRLLAEAPSRLSALTAAIAAEMLRTPSVPDEWSAVEVLAHLRSCADVWGGYMSKIIAEDQPTLRAISPRTWMKKTDYRTLEFQPSLQAFAAQRDELVAMLKALPPEGWERSATVKEGDKVRTWTVYGYARRLVLHEQIHIQQMAEEKQKRG